MISCFFQSYQDAYFIILKCLTSTFKVDVFIEAKFAFLVEAFKKCTFIKPYLYESHQLPQIISQQVAKGSYIGLTDVEEFMFPNDQMFKVLLRIVDKSDCYFETSVFKKKGKCTNEFITDILLDIVKQHQLSIAYTLNQKTTFICKGTNMQSGNIPLVNLSSPAKTETQLVENKIKVLPLTNWCNPVDYINQLNKFKPKHTNIEFSLQQPDYALVVNSTNIETNPARTLYYMMEPNGETLFESYLSKFTPEAPLLLKGSHKNHLQLQEYWISKSVAELQYLQIEKEASLDNVLSACVSDRYVDPGHKYRIDLLRECERLEEKGELGFKLHIYGKCASLGFKNYKGQLPEKDKTNGLFKYKYHFNAENHCIDNYITEKFNDALMSECYLFYYGASNANTYFNDCFSSLSGNIQQDTQTIRECILRKKYEEKIETIRKVKQISLIEQNIFHRIESTIVLTSKTIFYRCFTNNPQSLNVEQYRNQGWALLASNVIPEDTSTIGLSYLHSLFSLANQHKLNMVCSYDGDGSIYQPLLFKYARTIGSNVDIIVLNRDNSKSIFKQTFFITYSAIQTILNRLEKNPFIEESECIKDLILI